MPVLLNFVGFQLTWFALVVSGAGGYWIAGVGAATLWFGLHLWLNRAQRSIDIRLMICAALLGAVLDSALVATGFLAFPPIAATGPLTTVWMMVLWAAFAATLGHSLRWLKGRYLLCAAGGAISGPAAYHAGSLLGAVELPAGAYSYIAVSVEYALATPLLYRLRDYFESAATRIPSADGQTGPPGIASTEGR